MDIGIMLIGNGLVYIASVAAHHDAEVSLLALIVHRCQFIHIQLSPPMGAYSSLLFFTANIHANNLNGIRAHEFLITVGNYNLCYDPAPCSEGRCDRYNRFGGKSDRGRHNYNVENLIFVIYPAVPFTMRLNLKAALRFRSQGTKDSAHQVLFPGNGI